MRVLDFGCGYGKSMAWFLKHDVAVWGADVSPAQLDRAGVFMSQQGLDTTRMFLMENGKLPFEDESFDLVYSDQVIEHVADLGQMAAEIARVTKPRGLGAHSWPGQRRVVEVHVRQPFVHWLPKNRLRHGAMLGWAAVGVKQPYWPPELPEDASLREFVSFKYRYSVDGVFYRRFPEIVRTFTAHGLEATHEASARLAALPLGPLEPLAQWTHRTFRSAVMRTVKTG
jgi:ubiquinone/menaquinone biosynthesis C-methylase UbiE